MSKEQMTVDLDFTDPLLRMRVRDSVRRVSDAVTWLAQDLEQADRRVEDLTDEFIVTRLFCGVAFFAAQAMIDGARDEG